MLLSAQLTDPQFLLLAVMALMAAVLLFRARRQFGRRRRDDSSRDGTGDRSNLCETPSAPDALAAWEVSMHDTARRLSAQLDTKMSALQALIAEADRAAARLEAARAGAATSPPDDQPGEEMGTGTSQQPDLARSGTSRSEPVPVSSRTPAAPEGSGPPPRRHEEIYTLADTGYSPGEIAHRIGIPVEDVESILGQRGQP